MDIKKQNDVNECGLVVIQALHKHLHGRWIDINELKSRAYMSQMGINISSLVALGDKYGIELDPLEGTIEQLYSSDYSDFLIAMVSSSNENHYVIIKLRKKSVSIWDPVKGKYTISKKDFEKIYMGIIITSNAKPFKREKYLQLSFIVLKDPVVVMVIITSILISVIIVFSSSIYMKIILDKIIPQKSNKTLITISLIFIWLGVLKAFNGFIRKYFSRKISINVNYDLTYLYMDKMMNAKINDLDKVSKSDHLRRVALIDNVSDFISNIVFIIFGDMTMLFVSAGILFWISAKLFAIVIIAATISVSFTAVFNVFIKSEYGNALKLQGKTLASNIEILSSYEQIKECDYKKYIQNKFTNNFIKYKTSESKIFWYKTTSIIWEMMIDNVFPIVITFIATKLVFTGVLSVGSMIMFISLFRTFLHPLDSIVMTLMNISISLKNLNLLKYIFELEDEKLNDKGYISKKIKKINFNNINFGFDKTIFSIKSFFILKSIKLKGANGIGKTSFLKLISGRYDYSGDFFVNGMELDFINKRDFRNRIYYSNADYIPDVTIYEYITLLDQKRIETFAKNINKYNLHKLLSSLKLDLSKSLSQNGTNISMGQLQVVKLLRLLTKPYDIILLDEASDNITRDIIEMLSKAILKYQKGIFIEVSHNDKYISKGGVVNFEEIIKG